MTPLNQAASRGRWNIAGAEGNADVKKNFKVAESKMTSAQKLEAMKLARAL